MNRIIQKPFYFWAPGIVFLALVNFFKIEIKVYSSQDQNEFAFLSSQQKTIEGEE